MAGKTGPLIGPALFNRYVAPFYKRIWDLVKNEGGAKLFSQDSDGYMYPILDAMVEAGVNVTYPAEPAAGMDMVEIKRRYGSKLGVSGGLDKFILLKDQKAVRDELEYKITAETINGGCAFSLDHRIPNGSPLALYKYYVQTAREMLGLPALF
jgi:uroporphyrinogen-III decarboxylase